MNATVTRRTKRFGTDLLEALAFPFTSWTRLAAAGLTAAVTYLVLIMSTMPEFTIQMLGAGLEYVGYVVVSLTQTVYRSDGAVGLGTILVYAALTSVALVNTGAQVKTAGVSNLSDASGVLPGLLASGCASCGAGMLGFLGFAGALAAMPFHGLSLKVGGLVLLLFFLGRAGDPRKCAIR